MRRLRVVFGAFLLMAACKRGSLRGRAFLPLGSQCQETDLRRRPGTAAGSARPAGPCHGPREAFYIWDLNALRPRKKKKKPEPFRAQT